MAAVLNRLAVQFGDDVAAFEPGFFSRAPGRYVRHDHPGVVLQIELLRKRGRKVLNVYPKVAAHDPAIVDQPFHDVARQVRRHGKTDPLVAATAAENGSVDTDQTAISIDQRTA